MATYDFSGKTIVVTGAGAGIGKAICKKLFACRAKVIALSLLQSELDALEKELPGTKTIQVDLRDWAATRKIVESIGPVDGLVNNAGVAHIAPFLEATEEQFDKQYDVNVKAVVNVSQVVAKSMIDNNIKGAIVNISSIAALKAIPDHVVYCGTKASVDSLTKSMALELGPFGIRVNAINPIVVMTDLGMSVWSDPVKQADYIANVPLGRFGAPEDVANAAAYLLNDEATMISGTRLAVDGAFGTQ